MSRWYTILLYVVCMYDRCLDDILFYCTLYVFKIDVYVKMRCFSSRPKCIICDEMMEKILYT